MNETLVQLITEKVMDVLKNEQPSSKKEVKVGVSARHIHLSKEHLEVLFGNGYELNVKKYLMGDQFASEELVTIVGPKLRSIEKVRILGPVRKETQVEISATDAITLG
ncbi:PduL/EutD family phosphate acyltransferase, partial [Clostridium disporicum]